MTARNPGWTQGGSTSAEEDRALITATFPVPGVVASTDLAVTQHGTPNMSVDVAAGRVVLAGSESALQGRYLGWLDAVQNVVISASDPTNPRKDLIVARIKDAQYSGASNTFTVEVVTGTAAGSPVDPTVPVNCFKLARVAVGATVTTIVTANITDLRTGAGSIDPIVLNTSLYPAAFAGLGVYRMTNDVNEGPEFSNFTGNYRKAWNMPWGEVPGGRTVDVTLQSNADGSEHVIAAAATAITAVANRNYRITVSGTWLNLRAGAANIVIKVKDGVTLIEQARQVTAGTSAQISMTFSVETALTAGAHTINITHQQTTDATGLTCSASTYPLTVTVDDIGPSGAPS